MKNLILISSLFVTIKLIGADYSFQFLSDFETGTNGQPVTLSVQSNMWKAVSALSSRSYAHDNASNIFFISTKNLGFPTTYKWDGTNATDNGSRSLSMKMDTGGQEYVQWTWANQFSNMSFGFYFYSDMVSKSPDEGYFDVLYVERVWSANGPNTACALYHTVDNPYWSAHGGSNDVTVTGPPIYGMSLSETQWVTGLVTPTNFTLAVYNPKTWTQYGSNSVIQTGNPRGQFNDHRFLSWARNVGQPGKTTWIDNYVMDTNAVFPLIPTNWGSVIDTNTVVAASASYSDVTNAYAQVPTNGILNIPAGNVAWSNVFVMNKPVKIIGAGTNSTILSNCVPLVAPWSSGDEYPPLFYVVSTNNIGFRISGINIDCRGTNGGQAVLVKLAGSYQTHGGRIDHCFFKQGYKRTVRLVATGSSLLVDHCTFYDCSDGPYHVGGDNAEWALYTAPYYTLGTTNNMVVEDCYFEGASFAALPMGSDEGAHYIFRNNFVTNIVGGLDAHGNHHYLTGTGSDLRGTICVEVISNIFYFPSGAYRSAHFRGGTYMIFGNKYYGTDSATIIKWDEEEAWDSSAFSPVRTVWPAQDQITNSFVWNNSFNGVIKGNVGMQDPTVATFVQENRDYWLRAPQAGDAVANYTPLVYPHPLITSQDGTNTPAPPVIVIPKSIIKNAAIRNGKL